MYIKKNIKKIDKKKIINYILVYGTIFYGLVSSLLYLTVSSSLYDIVGNIELPDDYLLFILDPENPEFHMSYSIKNTGIYDVTDLTINISSEFIFYEKINNSQMRLWIFSEEEKVHIPALTNFKGDFFAGESAFALNNLEIYLNMVNSTIPTRFKFMIEISGKYFLNLIPFSIKVDNFEFNESCHNCGGG